MSYLVLARKWRPQTFADLVGQEHVAQTLKNALQNGRIAHAFLFTGARGVGKTTIARVLAKALNCMNAPGPTAEPCAKCPACDEIARGIDVDVKEIDGASNNSVDDVRKLQESLPYMPSRDRFKVVIIDEVHMLSAGAFNALLKTLEEPPPHVKFIFATTEVHKILPTILSRVQRYDFKLLPTVRIRERVSQILRAEGVRFEDTAVSLVAREAAGSMRDALSLLDQIVAGASGDLTGAEAARILGVANRSVLYDLARALLAGDAGGTLTVLQSVVNEGFDLSTLARDFLNVLRDLVVARVVAEPDELLDLADEERKDVVALAAKAERADLERLFVAWSRTTEEVSRAREPRWVLEMALVRLAHRPALVPVEELVARLIEMEKRLGSGAPAAQGTAGSSGRNPSPTGAPRPGHGGEPAGAPAGGGAAPTRPGGAGPGAPRSSATGGALTSVPGNGPLRAIHGSSAVAMAPGVEPSALPVSPAPAASPAPVANPPPVARATPAGPVPSWLNRSSTAAQNGTLGVSVPEAPPAARPAGVAAPAAPSGPRVDTRGAEALLDPWQRVLDALTSGPVVILQHAVPLEVGPERIRIAFEAKSFYARKVDGPEVPAQIAAAAHTLFGQTPSVELVQGSLPDDAPTLVRREDARRAAERLGREQAAKTHPVVLSFLSVLGGEIRGVKLDEGKE